MRKQFFAAFAVLLTVGCALAAEAASGTITRFGVYEMAGPPSGPWKVASVLPTTKIHAKQRLHFGFDFEIEGFTEASAPVVATLNPPTIVKPDGSS